MSAQKQQQGQQSFQVTPRLDFGPVSGPIVGALGALALTVAIWAAGRNGHAIPAALPLAIAMAGSGVAALVTFLRKAGPKPQYPIGNLIFRVSCWMGGGIWSFLSLTSQRGNFAMMLIVLIAAAVVAGIASKAFPAEDPAEVPVPTMEASYTLGPLGVMDAWARALQQLIGGMINLRGQETVTVTRIKDWANDSGATFLIQFSAGSPKGLKDVQNIQESLQQALQLPDGCQASVRRSGQQGSCLLDLMFLNDMETIYLYPEQWQQRTGTAEFPLGVYGDKTHGLISLYQDSMIINGMRGGGKTIILQQITAWMVQCIDVVVWHCDLNGGRLSAPWMFGTATGEINGYPIDWVAHCPQEALFMAEATEWITKARATAYQRLMMMNDTEKLPISPQVPMLLVIVDEGGEQFGEDADPLAREASISFQATQRMGRAVCVNIIFSVQRATTDYVPAKMKKACNVKVTVKVGSEDEIAYLFDWKKMSGLSSEDLVYPGSAYIQTEPGGVIRMIKMWYLKTAAIKRAAAATVAWRPALDPISAAAAGPMYANRWQRASNVAWLQNLAGMSDADLESDGDVPFAPAPGPAAASAAAAPTAVLTRPEDVIPDLAPRHASSGGLPDGLADTADLMGYLNATFGANTKAGRGGEEPGKHDRDEQIRAAVDRMSSDDVWKAITDSAEAEYIPGQPAEQPAGDRPGDEQDAANGREWTYRFVLAQGSRPVSVKAIVAAAQEAGIITDRRGTISDHLAGLLTQGRVFKALHPDGKQVYGHYIADQHYTPPAG